MCYVTWPTDIQGLAFVGVPARCVPFPTLFIDTILTRELFLPNTTLIYCTKHNRRLKFTDIHSLTYEDAQETPNKNVQPSV